MIKGGLCLSEPPAKPDREPIEDLSNGNKADPKTKPTEAAKAGDEVQPGHLWGSLELWNALWYISNRHMWTHQRQLALQRICSQWQCLSRRRHNRSHPENSTSSLIK